ncbi:MAG: glucokinase [Nitrospirota bacterium]
MILAGDIGGTKTVLALYRNVSGKPEPVREEIFKSREFPQFERILIRFLAEKAPEPVTTLCLGVAGAVRDGQCRTTNLPWLLDERKLAKEFDVKTVRLLNDLEAAAYGMLFLGREEMAVLHHGHGLPGRGNVAVIAAGTGLGEALLYWNGREHLPVSSEGGHADFAPQSDREIDLFKFLRAEFGHVSYERILSGPGLFNVYRFLRAAGGANEPPWLSEQLRQGDPSAIVAQAGLANADPLCVEALELFSFLYGAEAGNLALKTMATGGVYVGGGIAPKILAKLTDGAFMRGFTHKGRYTELMKTIPVMVALNSRAPLIGAAHYALRL